VSRPRARASAIPNQDLLSRCRRGDAQAWTELVAQHERLVFSVAVRNGLSREDAIEATQLTFVALLESIGHLRDDERLSYWLMTVARRQAWRMNRRHERERPWSNDIDEPEDSIELWERAAVVHDALETLSAPSRDLLHALYFDPARPSYAEIAERLGLAIGSIGPMRARCLARLRTLLAEDV
jgi:RNA polymerase sigma factor (sigma-70 family)